MRALLLFPLLLTCLTATLLPSRGAFAAEYRSLPHAVRELRNGRSVRERVAAANWLARRKGAATRPAAEALAASLTDVHPPVRRAAVNGLARMDARVHAPALRTMLAAERDKTVLPAALIALGTIGEPADGLRIDPFSQHPSPSVRAAAITGLARLPHRLARVRSMEALTRSDNEDPGWKMRAAALLALARVGDPQDHAPASAAFVEGDGQRFWFARSAYARMIAALATDPVEALFAMMKDPDGRVAVTAAEGLARSGHGDTLLTLLTHGDAGVRLAAVGGVEQARVPGATKRLRSRARRDVSRQVRWAAARALFRMDDPLGDELMLVGLTSREPAIWAEAIALLARKTGGDHARDVPAWRAELRQLRARSKPGAR